MSAPVSPIVVASITLQGFGYPQGVLYPGGAVRIREIARAVQRRGKWRLAAALFALARGIEAIDFAMESEPRSAERWARLGVVDSHMAESRRLLGMS